MVQFFLLVCIFHFPQAVAETATGAGGGGGALLSCPLSQAHSLHADFPSPSLSPDARKPPLPPPRAGPTPGTASAREENLGDEAPSPSTSTSLRTLPGSVPSATISRTSTPPSPQPLESLFFFWGGGGDKGVGFVFSSFEFSSKLEASRRGKKTQKLD